MPQFAAVLRVDCAQRVGLADDQFRAAVRPDNDRGAERADHPVFAPAKTVHAIEVVALLNLAFPNRAAAQLVERVQHRVRAGAVIKNAHVAEQHRRSAATPLVFLRPKVAIPELLSIEVVRGDSGRGEVGHHDAAVGRRRTGAVRVGLVGGFLLGVGDATAPKQLAGALVKTHNRATLVGVSRLRDEHLVAPDNRRAVAAIRQRRAPADVLFRVPLQRNSFALGQARAGQVTPPRRPIARVHPRRRGEAKPEHDEPPESSVCVHSGRLS